MINICTKFEVSIYTRYEEMKRDAKCQKWSGLGLLGVQGHLQCHHLPQHIQLPTEL